MNPMNLSFLQALKSKTVWAAAGLVIFNGLNAAAADPTSTIAQLHLSGNAAEAVNLLLGAVALYGRMRPTQGVPGKDPKAI